MTTMDTLTKGLIRSDVDKSIIQKFFEEKRRMLRYFGLPGKEILDVLEWKEYLKSIVGVEIDIDDASIMMHNVMDWGLEGDFKRLMGNIDEIMVTKIDSNGRKLAYPFDIVNLDYSGGMIHKDKTGLSKRVKSLRVLFQNQENCSIKYEDFDDFIFFLTLNTRQKVGDEYNKFWKNIDTIITKNQSNEETIDWYKRNEKYFITKIYIPTLIREIASATHYDCFTHEPITYKGSSDIRLIHFAFRLNYRSEIDLDIQHKQSLLDVLNLELKESRKINDHANITSFSTQPLKFCS